MQGNSALQSALKRMLFDEAAVNDQQIAAEIFIDIKKFYDHISWFRLIWHAVVTGFPKVVLIVGTYVHLALRQVRVRKVFSQPVLPSYGVVAGDNHAKSFSKCILYHLMQRIADTHVATTLSTYFDNVCTSIRGDADTVVTKGTAAVADICQGLSLIHI